MKRGQIKNETNWGTRKEKLPQNPVYATLKPSWKVRSRNRPADQADGADLGGWDLNIKKKSPKPPISTSTSVPLQTFHLNTDFHRLKRLKGFGFQGSKAGNTFEIFF